MHNHWIIRIIISACLLLSNFVGKAQDAESIRAANFMTLRRLLLLKATAPYYLTAADLAQIKQLQAQAQVCRRATTATCPPVAARAATLQLAGERINTEQAQLNWETIAAYNNSGFILERQSATNPSQYDSVLFVKGSDNPKSEYHYRDLNNYTGNSYYRVKQVDMDGKVTYSNVVLVKGYPGNFEITVAPNPAFIGQPVRVYCKGLNPAESISITLSSATGLQLMKRDNIKPGEGYIELPGQLLPGGYYFVSIYTNGRLYTKPLSVIK